MDTRVYSPSATETFSACPRKWALRRAGWRPRLIAYPELCAVLGEGFSESMRVRNEAIIGGNAAIDPREAIDAGIDVMRRRIDADLAAGRRLHEKDVEFADRLPVLLARAVHMYIDNDPLRGWTLRHAERSYPEHGNCRVDLIASDSHGPAVFDYKLKVRLDKRWEDAELDKYMHSQQRYHYCWAAGVDRFFIVLVVLGPKSYVKLSPPYGRSPYFETGLWLRDARSIWHGMAHQVELQDHAFTDISAFPGSPVHDTKYGPCEYADACLTHALDPAAMTLQYVQIERRDSVHKQS